jgi:hypothetical protein
VEPLFLDFKRRWRLTRVGAGVLAAGALVAMAVGLFHWQTIAELDRWDWKMAKMRRATGGQAGIVRKVVLSESEREEMGEVMRKLSLPWDRLFDEIEKADSKDVVLLSLQPEVKRGLVKIGGEARDKFAMLLYVNSLQEGGYFSDVRLLEHEVNERDPDKPVRFSISAGWGR